MTTQPPEDLNMALSPEAHQRKIKRNIAYNAAHIVRIPLDMNTKTDADILAFFQTVSNRNGLIKELLRTRMKEDGFTYEPEDTETC